MFGWLPLHAMAYSDQILQRLPQVVCVKDEGEPVKVVNTCRIANRICGPGTIRDVDEA